MADNHTDASFIKGVAGMQRNRHPFTKDPIALKTSMSQETEPRSGLTTLTVSEIMQGTGSYKPSGIAYDAFNQSMSGDLGHFIDSEGGVSGTLKSRAPLLAYDIYDGKRGFDDGIFTKASGINSGVSSVNSGESGPGGQTPHSAPSSAVPGTPGQRTSGVEAVLRWGASVVGIPYSQCIGRPQDPSCSGPNKAPTASDPSRSGRFGPDHYDCSGFITSAFFFGMGLEVNPAGGNYNTTYTMLAQPELMALRVNPSEVQPGDILLTQSHVAIWYGNGQIIDAGSPGVSIRNNWMHDAAYYRLANLPW